VAQYVNRQLAAEEANLTTDHRTLIQKDEGSTLPAASEQSRWLEMTKWPVYLNKVCLADARALLEPLQSNNFTQNESELKDEVEILTKVCQTLTS
jgi:hypothetical protein